MWLKLFLLLLYAFILFLLSRFLETVAWYENGYLPRQILAPFSLSVTKLKNLLEERGVSYTGVLEKSELTDLVDSTGDVTVSELEAVHLSEKAPTSATTFTCGTHFYEEVEDRKDSVWLVHVVYPPASSLLKDTDWQLLMRKVSRFGIQTGIFDCSLDHIFCSRKNWSTSRLILAVPQGQNKEKDHVKLITYAGSTKLQAVFDWINFNLASRIYDIKDVQELEKEWCSFTSKKDLSWPVRVIMLSKMILPSMFLSALSVKFTGRVKFGKVDWRTSHGKAIMKNLQLSTSKPSYIILTPERNLTYGKRRSENMNYQSFDLFLRTLTPNINDLFIFGLYATNLSCLISLAIERGGFMVRIGKLLWNFVKYNCIFLLLWLPLIGLFHIPYLEVIASYGAKFIRIITGTVLASYLRYDFMFYSSQPTFLLVSFTVYVFIIGCIFYKFVHQNQAAPETEWFSINMDGYFNYLFHHSPSLTQPTHPQDMEEGMELLIEHLAVPHFWLQPIITNDYIKDLPTWTYDKQIVVSSDADSDNDNQDMKNSAFATDGKTTNKSSSTHCKYCAEGESFSGSLSESECAELVMDGDYKCMCCLPQLPIDGSTSKEYKSFKDAKMNKKCTDDMSQKSSAKENTKSTKKKCNEIPEGVLLCVECVICLDSYHLGDVLCALPCGHNFHEQCILGWIMRDNHCCPVCRWPSYKPKLCKVHLHSE